MTRCLMVLMELVVTWHVIGQLTPSIPSTYMSWRLMVLIQLVILWHDMNYELLYHVAWWYWWSAGCPVTWHDAVQGRVYTWQRVLKWYLLMTGVLKWYLLMYLLMTSVEMVFTYDKSDHPEVTPCSSQDTKIQSLVFTFKKNEGHNKCFAMWTNEGH